MKLTAMLNHLPRLRYLGVTVDASGVLALEYPSAYEAIAECRNDAAGTRNGIPIGGIRWAVYECHPDGSRSLVADTDNPPYWEE